MKGSNLKFFVLGAALVASGLWAAAVTIPNTFSTGEVLSAAKINANFAAIKRQCMPSRPLFLASKTE